jgi:murein DD-endopeptidase MepM/ murein hydrolase activator NlpD
VKSDGKIFLSKLANILRSVKQRLNVSASVGVIIGIAFAVTSLGIYIDKNMVYAVKVNSKTVGYVKSSSVYEKALEVIRKSDGENPLSALSVQKMQATGKKFMTSEEIEKIAREELNLKIPGVIIYAENNEIGRVESFEAANKVLDEVQKYYLNKLNFKEYKILSTNIKEKITTNQTLMESKEILDVDETVEKIVNGIGIEKKYTIKDGDTIWDIAFNNGMTIEEIQAANPNTNLDKISIDQEINLALSQPYVNVEVVANVKAIEDVPYTVKNVNDSKIYKGSSKVTQKGKAGSAEVEKKVTVLNGNIAKEEIIASKQISPAVQQVVAVGTKAKSYGSSNYVASSSTGIFSWPARGLITSRFGYRGRELHTGLDVAVPRGTTVKAADSGVVSFAGWNGGYGYCVIINHKNGYQTLYGHNSKLNVKVGQEVSKGQKIASSGSTGRSTGPHVHFEVRKNGVPQNPQRYLN